jgi:fatty-acyl-CoA synthase
MGSFSLAGIVRKRPTAPRVNAAREAVRFGGAALTYDELDDRSSRLASGLVARGLGKGDRVAVLMYNRLEWVELFFALAKAGAVMVPVNYLLRPGEIQYILDDCGAGWLVCEDALAGLLPSLSRRGTTVVVGDGADAGSGGGDAVAYEAVVAAGTADFDDRAELDDLFLLQYTSGTTGFPKGAMHTHSTVLWNSFHQIPDFAVTADDVYLVVPALCWAAGFHDLALATLWAGGRVVLHPSTGFDPAGFLAAVEAERVTKTLLVPSVLKRVLGAPDFDRRDLSSLRLVISGGEPVPVPAIEEFSRRLPGCTLAQVYGMSEFPTLMVLLDSADATRKAGSTGKACRAAEIRVVDADGRDVAPGATGEIVVRSPACMVGYYGKDDATKATLADGWLHTGDLATVDDDGYVFIAGRSKDMIITGGLNVYPAEVERVIASHDAVVEAAVVGVADERWGEIGCAHVVLAPGRTLTAEELAAWLKEELASYKVPKAFRIGHDPLPRTTSGKVQKFLLRPTGE